MQTPKWLVIAKNEYLLKTSGMRRFRIAFPIIMVLMLSFYVFVLAPSVFSLFSSYTEDFFLSDAALSFMQVILFLVFVSIVTIPIMQTLQDNQVTPMEMLLSAPIQAKDILLGKYLGSLPAYSIVVTLIAGTFLALFIPFGMDPFQVGLSILVFILIVLIALWLGIVIAAAIKARLSRSVRGRDAGQALAMLIALPLVAVMYAVMNGDLMGAIQGKGNGNIGPLNILPSSWGADIVLRFLRNPGDLGADWSATLIGISGLMVFLIGSIYLGARFSDRLYDLEPVTFASQKVRKEGWLYRSVRWSSLNGPFSSVVVTVIKDYGRRLENLSRILYILGLVLLIELFMLSSLPPGNYVTLALLTVSWLMAFLCVFVVGEVTARGKDNLFVYRKAPHGESRLVGARVVQGLLFVLPVAAISALVVLMPSGTGPIETIVLTIWLMCVSSAYVIMSIGLFLLFPAFSEKPSEMVMNALLVLIISFFLFIFSVAAFGEYWGLVALLIISTVLGVVLLTAGFRKLKRLE